MYICPTIGEDHEKDFKIKCFLAKNDDAFSGLVLNIHSKNKIITKEELL